MAALEGKPRSADALANSDCVLYTLDGATLQKMQREHPALYSHFMLNVTRQLIGRLRATTLELGEVVVTAEENMVFKLPRGLEAA